jgi:hypothetical protein
MIAQPIIVGDTQLFINAASLWKVVEALDPSDPTTASAMAWSTALRTTAIMASGRQVHVSPSAHPQRNQAAYPGDYGLLRETLETQGMLSAIPSPQLSEMRDKAAGLIATRRKGPPQLASCGLVRLVDTA